MRVEGRVRVHARGFGFVEYETDQGPRSAFIAPPDLESFLHGDLVKTKVVKTGKNRFNAEELALVRRNRKTLFGQVVRKEGGTFLRPDRLIANADWPLQKAGDAEGQAIARIEGDGLVFERTVSDGEAALERVRARYGIRAEFPNGILDGLTDSKPEEQAHRRNLEDLVTVTIDAPSTKDLDDALAALPADEGGGFGSS